MRIVMIIAKVFDLLVLMNGRLAAEQIDCVEQELNRQSEAMTDLRRTNLNVR